MQTKIFGGWGWGLALVLVGLALAARNLQSADSNDAVNSAVAATPDTTQPEVANPGVVPPAAATASNFPPSEQPAPPEVRLSKGAAEIVKLAQSGVGEDVMLAYVGTVNSKFSLGSDQIVYLNDLGVSGVVIRSMIQRDGNLEAASQAAVASLVTPTPSPVPTYLNPPSPADTGAPPPMDNSDAANPPDVASDYSPTDDADYFYSSLAPYGGWIYVSGYGLCWQPTVCRGNHDWRPYCDRGRWLYSDCGWYWQSDYSWGWAAFHYGRWFNDANRGWVWAPNRVWGPAWVSWRYSADHCGWAPLPPSAKFVPGSGFFYANHAVAAGFEFGLQARQYTYIPLARMSDYSPARYSVPAWQLDEVHNRTVLVNHFGVENNRVVNHSIDPREVATLARTEIRRAEIRDLPRDTGRQFQSDRLAKSGNGMVIFRPQLPTPSAHRASGSSGGSGGGRAAQGGPHASAPLPDMKLAPANLTMTGSAQTSARGETYPSGSLVVIGNKNHDTARPAPAPQLPNMNLSHLANAGNNQAYQPGGNSGAYNGVAPVRNVPEPGRPSAGFNFNNNNNNIEPARFQEQLSARAANGQNQSAYVIPARYTAAQQLNGYAQHNVNEAAAYYSHDNGQAAAAAAPAAVSERPAHEMRSESHNEQRAEPRAESHNESRAADSGRAEVAHVMQAQAAAAEHSAPAQASSSSSSSTSSSGKR